MKEKAILDFLYELAMSTNITDKQIQDLCNLTGVSFQELKHHTLSLEKGTPAPVTLAFN